MEREREPAKEVSKIEDKELVALRKELARLRALKKQNELLKLKAVEKAAETFEKEEPEQTEVETVESVASDDIEGKFEEIEDFLSSKIGEIDEETYKQYASQIETELKTIEHELVEEKGILEEEISAYEKLLQEYPWLEEKKYSFMYSMPNKKKNANDFESWKTEWTKVLFDYARFAILHVLYLRQLNSEKPFSKFENRQTAIKEIAEELVNQKLAKYFSKKKEKLRVFWKTYDEWAEEIYEWAMGLSPLEPILLYEIRESNKEFSNLPLEDLEEILRLLSKEKKGEILKLDNGEIAFKLIIN